jgi:hypothetical protein
MEKIAKAILELIVCLLLPFALLAEAWSLARTWAEEILK